MSALHGVAAVDLAPFGLAVGHSTDPSGATGCTVVRGIDGPFRAAAAVVGRATGSRELLAASPEHLVDRVDAILLTGGSAYGLDAAAGVMRWLEARGRGFDVGAGVVPIVPAAVVFDLAPLGRFDARPTPTMAEAACDAATPLLDVFGSVGAGTGTTVGKLLGAAGAMKGGFGAAASGAFESRCAALAVVNAFGDVRDAAGRILAGARGPDGTFVDTMRRLVGSSDDAGDGRPARAASPFADGPAPMTNTTLAAVALPVALDRVALRQVAHAATAALQRRITPCGTTFDGDVVFATCPIPTAAAPIVTDAARLLALEATAAAALEGAIECAVRHAVGRDGVPGLADPAH